MSCSYTPTEFPSQCNPTKSSTSTYSIRNQITMSKWMTLFLVALLNKEVAHAFSLSCSGHSLDQCRSKMSVSQLNMKPVGSTSPKNPFLDRILSKKKSGPQGLFSIPARTNSATDVGLGANIFLRPDIINHRSQYQQSSSLFPRTLSLGTSCRQSRSQLNLSTLSCLRISPFPPPLGQGKHHQNLLALRKKAKLSSLILLAQTFEKGINVIDASTHIEKKKKKKRRSTRKMRLVKGLFSNRSHNHKKNINIVRMQDLTILPKERPSSLTVQSDVGDRDEIVFDLELAALTIPRELPVSSGKVTGNYQHPPFPKMKKPKVVPIAATWEPRQVKPVAVLRDSRYQGKSGIATILALGRL